jgi:hypothetical protein
MHTNPHAWLPREKRSDVGPPPGCLNPQTPSP